MPDQPVFQSDSFGAERRIRIQTGVKRSLAAIAALIGAAMVMVPAVPLAAAAWGWVVQRKLANDPGSAGRGLALAAVGVGLLMTGVQVAGFATSFPSWNRAQNGLGDALAAGDDRQDRLVAALDPDVAADVNPRLVNSFGRMLEHRYGKFVSAECDSSVAGVPLIGGGDAVAYELTFEDATLRADVELVPANGENDRADWAKVRRLVIHDPEVGTIEFPPPARPRNAPVTPALPDTAIAEVDVNP